MWFLWFCVVLQSVIYTEAKFGTPYLKSSRLCLPWTCVNTRLGLPMSLPPRAHYAATLNSLLPDGWRQAVENALDVCYGNRPRAYTNTCPGQALLHCTVDNLIENCPEESWRKEDACYTVSTLAGWDYMFSQSRYQNLEKSLPKERRPAWFMKSYFRSKCCNIPNFLNSSLISDCGFHNFLKYYDHYPKPADSREHFMVTRKLNSNHGQVMTTHASLERQDDDPLDCCDMKHFIDPSWRSECDFRLKWNSQERLTIEHTLEKTTTALPPTTTVAPGNRDIKIVPLSCEKEICVFRKLNVITESGELDREAYSKFLDNFTAAHLSWTKAKARVITQCLSKNSEGYEADCEINKLLSCTFDVLTENCPNRVKLDSCSYRSNPSRNHTVCQISSSKYRPKNRRSICGLPSMVDPEILGQCGASGIEKMEFVPEVPSKQKKRSKTGWSSSYSCQDSTPPTLCIMNKMGVLNKYSFLDYFKMKDHIRDFTFKHVEWSPLQHIILNSFNNMPIYSQYCSSPKKLLNVLDAMLITCPISKRKNTGKCNKFFDDILNTPPADYRNVTGKQLEEMLQRFYEIFPTTSPKPNKSRRPKKFSKVKVYTEKKPIFEYGVLGSKGVPPVKIIDVNTPKAPLVILPVYLRDANNLNPLNKQVTPQDRLFHSSSFLSQSRLTSQNSTEKNDKSYRIPI